LLSLSLSLYVPVRHSQHLKIGKMGEMSGTATNKTWK